MVELEKVVVDTDMLCSLDTLSLANYLEKQISFIFPDGGDKGLLNQIIPAALERLRHCFDNTIYSNNWLNSECYFNHLNADQYVIFIYFCSRVAFESHQNKELASKLFYLNKVLHSFHCMYDTILPDIFVIVHAANIVLGKATYQDYMVVMQNCTIGANSKFELPVLGKYLFMYPNSSILGNSHLGANVCCSNGSFINNESIPSNSIAFGRSPELHLKNNRQDRLAHVFRL
mgnify:CR=1 FL=1